MKAIIVISLDAELDQLPGVLQYINPPGIPYFAGHVRVAIDDPDGEQTASRVLDWLDE